ncbi:MAG: hypothetical protein KGL53_10555, partial [Elusimicrobia bacterium]|nr:hypothetical protein [Elusimicrobiota bacterium]
MTALWLAVLWLAVPARAGSQEADMVRALLPRLRADEGDLGMRPERWDAPQSLPEVEHLLRHPLQVPERALAGLEPGRPAAFSDMLAEAARRA